MNLTETLKTLCTSPGVAGHERSAGRSGSASEAALKLLSAYMPNAKIDSFGTVKGSIIYNENLPPEGPAPLLLLDAHIDEVGLIVNFIDEKGFLKVSGVGGIDRRVLPAAQVTVWGKEPCKGVICTLPPHAQKSEDKTVKEDEIYIDCGFTKENAEKIITLGDSVTIDVKFTELQNGKVTSRALDDRAGVAAILYALDLLKDKKLNYNIAVIFSSQEELGCRGAGIAAYGFNPDLAIAVDVSYGDYPGAKENTSWKLGGGTMLGISPVLDRTLFEKMKCIASDNNILYQIEVMNGKTGTNADVISLTQNGIKCALLSIPLRNMHTPVEVIQLSDIEATGQLIAEFIAGVC
ncbi:MAG: M20/M25/M40 family metallo-hydrolase [Oscillospiraceae bacterium]|nr:M20/M25/M40 family metallo-hydrolase [Oscillospiraceae bacterium]